MRTPPHDLPDHLVRAHIGEEWGFDLDGVEHLPWGFGAWHWAGRDSAGAVSWFITADRLDVPGRLVDLEQTYAAAAELSADLPAVGNLPSLAGTFCREVGAFALSVTPWVPGERSGHGELDRAGGVRTALFLADLHAAAVPAPLPDWSPQYASHRVLDDLAHIVGRPWDSGPFATEARQLVADRIGPIEDWRRRYAELAELALARRREWVVTHGEPGPHNQIGTSDGTKWVDWESARAAPRERDLTSLSELHPDEWRGAYPHPIDREMLELFDLAWRLDEIGQYTSWFRRVHLGTEDDRIALDGLRQELTRADWPRGAGNERP